MFQRIIHWIKKHNTLLFISRLLVYSAESNPIVYHCRDYTSNNFVRILLKVIVTPYCLLKYFFVREYPGRSGLAFVLIAKNEGLYIKEWLDFHLKQGVSHFIIYDNESTDNFREVVEPYVQQGVVTYRLIKGKRRQLDAYNMALNKYRSRFKYMGFIDADEFVFVRKNTYGGEGYNLYEFIDGFMNTYPNAGGILINWLNFGSSHHDKKPEGGVLENFTMCAAKDYVRNRFTKFIGDPAKLLVAIVHISLCCRKYYALDENGEIFSGRVGTKAIKFEKIRINHYFCKSREEFILKMDRGKADKLEIRSMSEFDARDKNVITDTEILARR